MSNPLYGQFGGQQNNNAMSAFMNDFRRLQQTVRNPRQEVERLCNRAQCRRAISIGWGRWLISLWDRLANKKLNQSGMV